jgi:hypothetical protein
MKEKGQGSMTRANWHVNHWVMAQKEEAGWDKLCWKPNPALATVKLSHKFLINGISHEILKVLNHEGSNHVREQTSLQRISSFGIPYELILIGYYLQKLSSHSFWHATFQSLLYHAHQPK